MIKIKTSKCICGKCGNEFMIEWNDLNIVYSKDRSMGEETEYESEINIECSECKNQIRAVLNIWEYPVGSLNTVRIERISDSMKTGKTQIEKPNVYLFDI